jgi:hypothetical protein
MQLLFTSNSLPARTSRNLAQTGGQWRESHPVESSVFHGALFRQLRGPHEVQVPKPV